MATSLTSPGTVSRILWHFTGGPIWDNATGRQHRSPKSATRAYRALKSILRTRELRLGSYQEIVRINVPRRRVRDRKSGRYRDEFDVIEEIASSHVCCLAEIPVIHLSYLASRYGKFAIGFHRETVVRHGFNPVFYTLENTAVIRSIHAGFTGLRYADAEAVRDGAESARQELDYFASDYDLSLPGLSGLDEVENAAHSIENYVDGAIYSFENFLGFVKTFTREEFSTIYCEREWRSLKAFSFAPSDLAMIVVPRVVGKQRYFERLVKSAPKELALPSTVPIVPWEDLVEH